MLKDEGFVLHLDNLIGHFGRAFYGVNPTFFQHFYQNQINLIKPGVDPFKIYYFGIRVKKIKQDDHDHTDDKWSIEKYNPDKNYNIFNKKSTSIFKIPLSKSDFLANDSRILCLVKRNYKSKFNNKINYRNKK